MYISKDKILASDLFNESYKYLVDVYGRSPDELLSPSSPFVQVIGVLSEHSELIFQYIENAISELNISTARNKTNVNGLARLVGHNASRGIAAKGSVQLKMKHTIPDFTGDYIIVPKYSQIKCLNNNLNYILLPVDENIKIYRNGQNVTDVYIIEGERETQQFEGDGTSNQSFAALINHMTDHNNIYITVNDINCRIVESLIDLQSNEYGCIVRTGINGGIDVYFGNSSFGYIPKSGELIKISYIKTNGSLGNVEQNIKDLVFKFADSGYTILNDVLDLSEYVDIKAVIPPDFGANEETLEFTRSVAPYVSRNHVLINADSYYYYLKKFNYFSTIYVYNTVSDQYKSDDNITYLFLIPDYTKKIKTSTDYFNLSETNMVLNSLEKQMILNLINESGQQLIGSEIRFVDPLIKRYVINVVITVFDKFDQEIIKSSIFTKLGEYFINVQRRDIVPRSDLIALLKTVNGIDSVNVFFISEDNEKAIINGFYTDIQYIYNPNTMSREWTNIKQITLQSGEDPNIGLNEFGDIKISDLEMPIIRGGWKDRDGRTYTTNLTDSLSSVNIFVKDSITYNLYTSNNQQNFKNLLL